jgi:cell division protein ZipA
MPELRWILLVFGVVFIVGLACWELRRQHQARRQSLESGSATGGERVAPTLEGDPVWTPREPTISFPEVHPEPAEDVKVTAIRREPTQDPPVVEIDSASFDRLHVEGEAIRREAARMEPELQEVFMDADPARGSTSVEPVQALRDEPILATRDEPAHTGHDEPIRAYREVGAQDAPSEVREAPAPQAAESSPAHRETAPASLEAPPQISPRVEWPPESVRRIIALRLVSPAGARFSGRAVRQALVAEGFVFGKFDIFHKAGPDDRALLSAASLTKPGTFALNSMDGQRFGGLSLFAVLPGPLPPQETFDELLATARCLNDRLQGALQDERGEPLTPVRSAAIRQSLAASDRADDAADETTADASTGTADAVATPEHETSAGTRP